MGRHHFQGRLNEIPVDVELGYDHVLHELHLSVLTRPVEDSGANPEFVYDSDMDPDRPKLDIDYFKRRLDRLEIAVPETMFKCVAEDVRERVGNYSMDHFADCSTKVRAVNVR